MSAPNCPRCKTNIYLRYLEFTPAKHYTRRIPTGGGRTITRQETDAPVSTYKCRKCGHFNGHSVPMDWTEPVEMVTDDQILEEFGAVYPENGTRMQRTESGEVSILRGKF